MKKIKQIIQIARNAGEIHLKHYKRDIEITHKNGDQFDQLTKADLESEAYVKKELNRLFPSDYILSEESPEGAIDYSKRGWMVDPLDGTKDYTAHNDAFSILIGLSVDGIPVLGVVYAAAHDLLWYAEKGKGAFRVKDGDVNRIQVSVVSELSNAIHITRNPHGENRPLDVLIDGLKVRVNKPEGSVGIKLCRIASGEGDFHVNTNFRCSKWDTCAPQIILEEAGGKLTTIDGDPLDYKQKGLKWERSFVGSNTILHDQVLSTIKACL